MASASSLFLRTRPTSLVPAKSTRKSKRGIGTATTSHYTPMRPPKLQELARRVGEPRQKAMDERLLFPRRERQLGRAFQVLFERSTRRPGHGRVVNGDVALAVVTARARVEVVGADGDQRFVENSGLRV